MARVQFSFTPGKVRMKQEGVLVGLSDNGHCENCKEPRNESQLADGICFDPCRYGAYLLEGKPLRINASYQGASELDFKSRWGA